MRPDWSFDVDGYRFDRWPYAVKREKTKKNNDGIN
jgi:hypothetical protein